MEEKGFSLVFPARRFFFFAGVRLFWQKLCKLCVVAAFEARLHMVCTPPRSGEQRPSLVALEKGSRIVE